MKQFALPRTGLRCITLASALIAPVSFSALASDDLTLYTTREPGLIQPLLDSWTKSSGIKVNTVYIKDGMLERVKAEGQNSPADLLMAVDVGNLVDLVEAGVTQPVESEALKTAIPANLRGEDNQWFALSMRARVLYAEKDLPIDNWHYEQLANPEYKGKVCLRSGQHPYNTALVAAMISHHGEAKTETWLRGVKDNLARKATGGDRDVARDILGGICDMGLANSYYVGQMKSAKEGSDARKWGDAIKVVKPTFEQGGTHVNISGAAVARHAPNKDNAVKLMEYLVSAPAQQIYAKANYEFPVLKGVALDPIISEAIGEINVDSIPLTEIVKHRKQASLLVDKVGFDQ
ncbi:iron(III) transport system substrate-binding protein [Enterobacter sp. BIGb0383]|uniref:extracellular solute-binding protein n=1 Tax=unclassified Enterobacter TaxID=2608935 RepID=UPI000F491D87|nr:MULTISPECIES: extracellular solute-binding protein [unclassified Enterobacter]ROP58278.1 iron(III) transport system substrate-binding protein [Enterobacter sp. BIGb0383]ROS06834.1 iron(III) transport system substrate-binding protein [Enterobacter sp. BIGb0359]